MNRITDEITVTNKIKNVEKTFFPLNKAANIPRGY